MKRNLSFATKLTLVLGILCSVFSFQIKTQQTAYASGFGNPTTVNGMLGYSVPEGTIATASTVYDGRPASFAIDRNDSTYWTGKGYEEYVQLQFPTPLTLDYVQVSSAPLNASTSTYTILGLVNNEWQTIGSYSAYNSNGIITPPIVVVHGSYDKIRVKVKMDKSWVGINEITIGNNQTINLNANAGNSNVTLNWNVVENAESYTVKYGIESGAYTETVTATKDEYDNYVIPGLTNGTTYYFVVSATVNGVLSNYSNEATATPMAPSPTPVATPEPTNEPTPTPTPTVTPSPTPEQPTGDRAILVVTMNTGLEKEFDLSMEEVNSFIAWYENKQSGTGKASYAIDKHDNNKGPFTNRKDYVIFDKILTFSVDEYSAK